MRTINGQPPALVVASEDGAQTYASWVLKTAAEGAKLSPDRTRIVASDGNGALYVQNTADGTVRQIVSRDTYGATPDWSPDGHHIVYQGATGSAVLIDADGSNPRAIVGGSSVLPIQFDPVWSPDGRSIAFDGSPPDDPMTYIINIDGSGLRMVAVPSSGYANGCYYPAWSPDGRRLSVVRHAGPASNHPVSAIWIMNADGSGARQVSPGVHLELMPSWSPDGTRIVYEDFSSHAAGAVFYIVDVVTGVVTPYGWTHKDRSEADIAPRWIRWP